MNYTLRHSAVILSGLIGFFIPALFALDIYKNNLEQNLATWSMVLFMDMLGVILAFKAGNKRPLLQMGWLAAAVLILSAICLSKSSWHWGVIETLSLISCIAAVYLWQTRSARHGIYFYVIAGYVSFFPQIADYWKTPQPGTLYLWLTTVIACTLAIYGAEKRDFANTFVPIAFGLLNVLIAVLVLR